MKLALPVLLLLLVPAGLACASSPEPMPAGFLDRYGRFEPAASGSGALVQWTPDADLGRYSKLMIDPVVVWYSPDAQYRGIHPGVLQRLAEGFRASLVKHVEDAYPVVDEPGPGVLRLRTALIDVVPGKPVAGTLSTVVPGGLAVSTAKRAATGTHLFVGEAALEGEIVDSVSGERIVAFIDRREGSKLDVAAGATTWGHVEAVFDEWASGLRASLDAAHDRETPESPDS